MRKNSWLIASFHFVMSFIGLSHSDWFVDRIATFCRYTVEKASATLALIVPVAEWKVVERMCTLKQRVAFNIHSRRTASTGSLSAPLLS